MEEQKPIIAYTNFEFAELNPKESAPVFTEVRGKDWIPYLSSDGNSQYPEKLIELFTNSALHGAILRSKIDQVSGNGFIWDASEGSDEMDTFMSAVNDQEDANEVLWKLSNDLNLFGGVALLINWSKDWTKIVSIEHIDFSKVRCSTVDDNGKISGYYYSWDWSKQRNDRVFIPAFNEATASENKQAYEDAVKKGNSEELQKIFLQPTTQIFYYKPYISGYFYYPLPSYVGCINSIETDIMSDQYGTSAFKNGLNTDVMVTFFNIRTPEAKNEEARKFLKMHTGAAQAKKPLIAFADDATQAPKVDNIGGSKEDKLFMTINENTMQKILSGHRVTDPVLVGIKTPGELGNSDLGLAIDFWNKTVINPMQQTVTKIWNKFMDINEFPSVDIAPFIFTDEVVEPEEETDVADTDADAGAPVEMDRMKKGVGRDGIIRKYHTVSTRKNISKKLKEKKLKTE